MKAHRMVAAARAAAGLTQEELAERLTEVTGERWDRNAVAAIENGRRKFTVDDLDAFREAQGVSDVSFYLRPAVASVDDLPRYLAMPPIDALVAA